MDNNSYSKQAQIARTHRIHRNPDALRAILRLAAPQTREESEARRYGKCSVPSCGAVGTSDQPLDLHHIIPRSQSRARIDDFTNHVYLCGDFFPKNHHKGLHGEATPGRVDWQRLGVAAAPDCQEPLANVASVDEVVFALVKLISRDRIANVLLSKNIDDLINYAKKIRVLDPDNKIPVIDPNLIK